MSLTITLQPEIEARSRMEAADAGLAPEELAAQRLRQAELLWRIYTATPQSETRLLHKMLRRRQAGTISQDEALGLQALLDQREECAAQRMEDLAHLSQLRAIPLHQLMERLAIRSRESEGT